MKRILGVSLICLLMAGMAVSEESAFPKLSGPYLGQKPPGLTPEIFAPGIVSTDAHEFSCCFSPDGAEFYFARRHPELNQIVIMQSQLVDGHWTEPIVAPFVENQFSFEPSITPDNQRLYFQSGKPIPGESGPPMNVLYVERQGGEWSLPKNPGAPFNPAKTMRISSTSSGTLYVTDISAGPGTERLGMIKKIDGAYKSLERLGPPFESDRQMMYPFVAPDESYLIYISKSETDKTPGTLFISFKKSDGAWGTPQIINLGGKAGLPFVSSDGKFLFFTGGEQGKSDIYWVDAKVIDNLKPKE